VAARRRHFFLRRKRAAARHFDLEPHEVQARHALGHGMLDLEARVYFQEKELSRRREQEFDGSGVTVANRFARGDRGRADLLAEHRGQRGARRFLDDLLVPPLNRAFALVEMDHATVCVAEDLYLDVPRGLEVALEVNGTVAERRERLAAGRGDGLSELRRAMHHAHASATAAGRGLHDDG